MSGHVGKMLIPGTGTRALGKAHNALHSADDVGVKFLGVRYDLPATTIGSAEGRNTTVAITRYGAMHVQNVPGNQARTASFSATGSGAADSVANYPRSNYSMQVAGVGGTPTSWTVNLQVSLDGTNFHNVATHSTADGNGAMVFVTGKAAKYYRAQVNALVLGPSASAISVLTLGIS